jgi:plastocyanin
VRVLSLVLAGLAGLGLAVLPKVASGDPPSTGSFTASDDFWTASGGGSTVNIATGGTVTFSYPSGFTSHNADFSSGTPSSCTQTAGTNSGAVPPLPHDPASQGWSGSCTFNQPGTYQFHCDLHSFMTGTIVVGSGGSTTGTTGTTTTTTTTGTTTTTTTTGTTTTTTTPSPGPTSPNPPPGSPLVGSAGQAIHVASGQRGRAVRGTLKVSAAGVGGALRVTLMTGRQVVGRSHATLHAGTFKFSVKLTGAAVRMLGRRGTLSLTVKLVVRARSGRQVTATRRVKLRR